MSKVRPMQRVGQFVRRLLGPKLRDVIELEERVHHVQAASAIGIVIGSMFSIFNLRTDGMLPLGLAELAAVVLLVVPAAAISRTPRWVTLAESLLLLAALVIFGALIVFGGVEGTGLFWVYTAPFLAFFLKGQRLGWCYSVAFTALVTLYFVWLSPVLAFAHRYSPVVSSHFLMSLGFYTLIAAAFNHVRSRFEDQLQQRKEKVEAAYLAKSRFLAAASHDLRQPAHALGMFVARLTQLPNDPPTRELVAGVDASVRALQDMLDAFFDYSRLDAQSMQGRLQTFAIEGVFEQLRHGFASSASAKGLRLRIRPSRAWVHSDPILLHRVLLNLVSNAVQHTQHGSIFVSCRPTADLTQARLEVWDSGVGIAADLHEKIFEEFFQIQNPERDRSKGLGLGLSIVDRTCRLLNHPISLRSALGCGTRFTLRVPLAPTPATRFVKMTEAPQMKQELAGLHVLLVEDDALGSAALAGLLASWGCQVTVAGTAQMACELVRQGPLPDFVVSDYRLRGPHNGIDAVRLLRAQVGPDLAACLISGDTDVTLRQQSVKAGLTLLQKPVQPAKLRNLLRHYVQDKSRSAQVLDCATPL